MARLSALFALFGLLSSTLATANTEIQRRKLDCINTCFYDLPGGSCVDYPKCMCSQKDIREMYFCCVAKKCEPSALSQAVNPQHHQCGLIDMQFTFDVEAACGITLTTSSTVSTSAASTAPAVTSGTTSVVTTGTTSASPTDTSVTSAASTENRTRSSGTAASQTSSGTSISTPTNGAGSKRVGMKGVGILGGLLGVIRVF